jgi:hypothetical protein
LEGRLDTAKINDSFVRVAVSRSCPQAGLLSPLLWCLFVDDLIARLNMRGVNTQCYADDICLLAVGKFPNRVSGLMQWVRHTVVTRCGEVSLSANPTKLNSYLQEKCISEPVFFGINLHRSMLVKYLGIVLDSRLTWREHVNTKVQ